MISECRDFTQRISTEIKRKSRLQIHICSSENCSSRKSVPSGSMVQIHVPQPLSKLLNFVEFFICLKLTNEGYTVSILLNDTQDYDLIVDINGLLKKVQVKGTLFRTKYGIY